MSKRQSDKLRTSSGLFGIKRSNRSTDKHWGKNCFNSSFPAAMACHMLAHDIPAIYNKLTVVNGELKVEASESSLREVFNSGTLDCGELDFRFESRYVRFSELPFMALRAANALSPRVSTLALACGYRLVFSWQSRGFSARFLYDSNSHAVAWRAVSKWIFPEKLLGE